MLSEFLYTVLSPAYLHVSITIYSVNGLYKKLRIIFF